VNTDQHHTEPQAFYVRPRFELMSSKSIDEACDQFKEIFSNPDVPYEGKVRLGYVSIFPRSEDKHYWSPHLSITLSQSEEEPEKTKISGLYGPAPEVWTMFVFFYAVIGLAIVIVTVIGLASRSIGESSAILWAIPILILSFGSMYAVSYFGQKKGHDQVEGLYGFMLQVIND